MPLPEMLLGPMEHPFLQMTSRAPGHISTNHSQVRRKAPLSSVVNDFNNTTNHSLIQKSTKQMQLFNPKKQKQKQKQKK